MSHCGESISETSINMMRKVLADECYLRKIPVDSEGENLALQIMHTFRNGMTSDGVASERSTP